METVKLLLLKNGLYVISYIEELEMEPSCFLADPMEIIDGEFKPFPKYRGQRNVLLYSDFIATFYGHGRGGTYFKLRRYGLDVDGHSFSIIHDHTWPFLILRWYGSE